jgi:extracellular factor (EF) 3-hydroxypalmitic acid methyl ester biosynthesis protein
MQSGASPLHSGLTLLSALSDPDVDWILRSGIQESVSPGTIVVAEAETGDFIYLVLDGLLAVCSNSLGGREIARLGPGQIFGEMSFLEDRPASATVKTVEESHLLALPRRVLDVKLEQDPAFAGRLYKSLAIIAARRLRELVGTLSRWMEAEDQVPADPDTMRRWQGIADMTQEFKETILRAEKAAPETSEETANELMGALNAFCEFMNAAIGDTSVEALQSREDLGARIQREILPYFLKSDTVEALFHKPRGYAGDYSSIDRLYQNIPSGSGQIGPILDRCFLNLPMIVAIRNRKTMIATVLASAGLAGPAPTRVTAIVPGPADELFLAFEKLRNREDALYATVVDFDAQALAAVAVKREQRNLTGQIDLSPTNLFDLTAGREQVPMSEQDIVYTVGLADYLDDRLFARLLSGVHRLLRPGGKAIVASFAPHNAAKAFMDYVVDWKLFYRSEAEVNELFAQSDFGQGASNIRYEPQGLAFLAECVKQSA